MTALDSREEFISGGELQRRTRASYRQVHRWSRLGLLRCLDPAPGSGNWRMYPSSEVPVVNALAIISEALRGKEQGPWDVGSLTARLRRSIEESPEAEIVILSLTPEVDLLVRIRGPVGR